MAQQYSEISDRLAEFIAAQHMFFVATAAHDGRVNISPKGLDALRVLGPNRVLWRQRDRRPPARRQPDDPDALLV